MPLPLGLITSAIGGFASAFDKNRYKTDYHYARQDVLKKNNELKKQLKQLKHLKQLPPKNKKQILLNQQPKQIQNKKTNVPIIVFTILVTLVSLTFLIIKKIK